MNLASSNSRSGTAAIQLAAAARDYGAVRAVAPVDLRIDQGETVALLGPSGAGKTTLLQLMAGEVGPTTGSVTAFSKDLADLDPGPELASLVGMIHQQFDLVPNLSALQNTLVGQLGRWGFLKSVVSLAVPRDSDVALAALERVGIADRVKQRVSRLSGGEQQRVAIARLLVQNPRLILADEPVASLDPTRAEEVLDLMLGIAAESRKTFVASIHLVELARDRFDRLIGMRNGNVMFDLPSDTVTDAELSGLYELEGRRVTT